MFDLGGGQLQHTSIVMWTGSPTSVTKNRVQSNDSGGLNLHLPRFRAARLPINYCKRLDAHFQAHIVYDPVGVFQRSAADAPETGIICYDFDPGSSRISFILMITGCVSSYSPSPMN
ncbi:MAG: hypothetical protein M1281_01055 [Chloroflexi bacterium]|nr:hypothetical protein [Chloroflexota bacterium]